MPKKFNDIGTKSHGKMAFCDISIIIIMVFDFFYKFII